MTLIVLLLVSMFSTMMFSTMMFSTMMFIVMFIVVVVLVVAARCYAPTLPRVVGWGCLANGFASGGGGARAGSSWCRCR